MFYFVYLLKKDEFCFLMEILFYWYIVCFVLREVIIVKCRFKRLKLKLGIWVVKEESVSKW